MTHETDLPRRGPNEIERWVPEDLAPRWLPGLRTWVKFIASFALCVVALIALPMWAGRLGADSGQPPVQVMVTACLIVSVVTGVAVYSVVVRDLKLPRLAAGCGIGASALILLVKFVLAPAGMYQTNRSGAFQSYIAQVNNPFGAAVMAALVFSLYFTAFILIYMLFRPRLVRLSHWRPLASRSLILILVAGIIAWVAVAGGWFVTRALASDLSEYLKAIFASSLGLVLGAALAGTAIFIALAFHSVSDRSRIVGDATLAVSFFWTCLLFLSLYHVLWVVYILILTTVWPLRVVVPK